MIEEKNKAFALLLLVHDRESFVRFGTAFAAERAQAEALEASRPHGFKHVGPFGWKNSQISDFIYCGLARLDEHQDHELTWMMLAEMLYLGKTMD